MLFWREMTCGLYRPRNSAPTKGDGLTLSKGELTYCCLEVMLKIDVLIDGRVMVICGVFFAGCVGPTDSSGHKVGENWS